MPAKDKLSWKSIGIITLLSLLLSVGLWWQFAPHEGDTPGIDEGMFSAIDTQKKFPAQLYFSDNTSGKLIAEKRSLPKLPLLESQAKLILKELTLGPKLKQLSPTIPPQSQLREFYLDQQGCAYLDFDAGLKRNHPGGSSAELLTIASLVKTITANFAKVKQVKLLINGSEIETLAGHIDTRFPFTLQNLAPIPLPPKT